MENSLKGKVVKKVLMNEQYLKFETDQGDVTYRVDGDCCSNSYFYDFIGADKILGKKVLEFKEVCLDVKNTDIFRGEYGFMQDKIGHDELIEVYGYQIIVEDLKFGELTAVFSFRNASNGYYGGSMELANGIPKLNQMTEVKDNLIP